MTKMNRRKFQIAPLAVLLLIAMLMVGSGVDATAAAGGSGGFRALSGPAAATFRLPDDVALVQRFVLARYGLVYERYQQFYGEAHAEVLGGQLTLYKDGTGTTRLVIGAHYPDITPTNAVLLSAVEARRIVAGDIGAAGQRFVDLMIHPATGRYFYRVETRRADSRWIHWIDAGDGRVLNKFDALAEDCGSLTAPCGFGVAYDDGDSTDLKDLSGLTTFDGSEFLLQSPPEVSDANGKTYQRQETHDQGSSRRPFLGPIATDDDDEWVLPGDESPAQPALVDAQYYADVTDDYYLQVHGYDWVASGDADPDHDIQAMVIHAHYSKDYNNAFWNGSYVALGDGDQEIFRELTSLDVVGHELTHGVTDFTSNLIYEDESGALNESFSDILGNSIEFFAEAAGREPATTLEPDWYIGEDIYLPEKGTAAPGFRNMADPEEDGDPDHYSERQVGGGDNGGVHTNSGIPNHAYYLLVNGGLNASCASPDDHNSAHCSDGDEDDNLEVTAIGLADAERIFFLAFIGLPENAVMCDARLASEAAADSLFGASSQQRQSTTDAWVAVGLTDAVCGVTDATPTVSIVNPEDGSTVSGTVTIQIDAQDAEDAAGTLTVEWNVDGGTWQSATYNSDTGYYEASWDTTTVDDGAHTINARATDSAGNVGSDSNNVTVDNVDDPPTASIVNPQDGSTVSGTVTIQVEATDDRDAEGTLTVEVSIDGGAWQLTSYNSSTGYYELDWDTTTLEDGTQHTIDARATDSGGNTTYAAQVTVTVDNSTPSGNENDMYVWAIDFAQKDYGPGGSLHDLMTTVTIRRDTDADGVAESTDDPVADASVKMTLTHDTDGDGVFECGTDDDCWNFGGTTDSAGQVTFTLKFAPTGDYEALVTDVTHSTFTWNPALDADNPDYYTLQ
jgi:thermolysin